MKKFEGKVIWITGASSGIGKATAEALAKEKATLILTALESDILAKEEKICIEKGAADVYSLPYDLSDLDSLNNLADQAWKVFDGIDIVYNNAGISQRSLTVETDMKVFHKVMNIDYFAPVIITKNILPKMLKNGGGQFVITTSIAGKFGFPMRSAYCSAKHALYGFFETVQAEYYKHNIHVTIICPGRVKTNISLNALEKDGTPHGKMDKGQAGGISPEKAGRKIVSAIYHKKREVLVGGKELIMTYIKRFFPNLAAKTARNIAST